MTNLCLIALKEVFTYSEINSVVIFIMYFISLYVHCIMLCANIEVSILQYFIIIIIIIV